MIVFLPYKTNWLNWVMGLEEPKETLGDIGYDYCLNRGDLSQMFKLIKLSTVIMYSSLFINCTSIILFFKRMGKSNCKSKEKDERGVKIVI